MVSIVTDSSFILAWGLDEPSARRGFDVLEQIVRGGAIVPAIWSLEIANVLLSWQRHGGTQRKSRQILANIADLPIHVDRRTHEKAWSSILILAEKHALTSYDAAYLELALREDAVLATLDDRLAKAARKEGVLVLPG